VLKCSFSHDRQHCSSRCRLLPQIYKYCRFSLCTGHNYESHGATECIRIALRGKNAHDENFITWIYIVGISCVPVGLNRLIYNTRSIWIMFGPFATASRRTPLFYIVIHKVPLLSHDACAIAIAIDVHNNNDDNNDNAWQRGPLWPHRMGPNSVSCRHAVEDLCWLTDVVDGKYVKARRKAKRDAGHREMTYLPSSDNSQLCERLVNLHFSLHHLPQKQKRHHWHSVAHRYGATT